MKWLIAFAGLLLLAVSLDGCFMHVVVANPTREWLLLGVPVRRDILAFMGIVGFFVLLVLTALDRENQNDQKDSSAKKTEGSEDKLP